MEDYRINACGVIEPLLPQPTIAGTSRAVMIARRDAKMLVIRNTNRRVTQLRLYPKQPKNRAPRKPSYKREKRNSKKPAPIPIVWVQIATPFGWPRTENLFYRK
jgi:phage-related baseplate assembly protein